jgi:subtilisin-like proprotein convertase family protein
MKTLFKLLVLIPFFFSCSKSDDSQPSGISFENNNAVTIIDDTPDEVITPVYSEINVTASGTIKEYKKITLEMNIQHDYQRDLEFALVAPDGTSRTFIYRAGLANKYLAVNKLRFNATFSNYLPEDANFAAGNYRETKGSLSSSEPALEPIFTFLQNKSINGIWKLKAVDRATTNIGAIKSWKLIFDNGAF